MLNPVVSTVGTKDYMHTLSPRRNEILQLVGYTCRLHLVSATRMPGSKLFPRGHDPSDDICCHQGSLGPSPGSVGTTQMQYIFGLEVFDV